jgi:hypothetical protein
VRCTFFPAASSEELLPYGSKYVSTSNKKQNLPSKSARAEEVTTFTRRRVFQSRGSTEMQERRQDLHEEYHPSR